MPTSTLIHVVPIQISLSGEKAIITCSDSRAYINAEDELIFELQLPGPNDPPVNQFVSFVATDPPDTDGYDDYLHVYSAPPLERLKVWGKVDTTSTSPNFLPSCDLEVVVVAFREPRPSSSSLSAAVQVREGRRRFKIRYAGAGGSDLV